MSELQAHHCIIPEQWTCFLRSVSAIPVNKMLLQELDQLIGMKMLTSDFRNICFLVQFLGEANSRLAPPADAHESMIVAHRISFKNEMFLKKFKVIWQP